MPRTVLRQFTGGISNEIDAQNLRDDQGEEAVDINLKGFALEPGEGLAPLTDAGHYFYRGEWIKDSEAVSFEESGVGVVKTYDTKRPQFEEIINDKDNVARNLGPALPPGAVITGTIVSEGTRGERPGDGAHLLELPSDKLGAIDTADPITDAPSLEEHKATSTKDSDHIYYYAGQPYWVEKTGDTWNVKTRAYVNNKFTSNDITSGNLTHNSGGSFFKENYFICWDAQFIETVALSNSAMSVNAFDTIDTTQNGDVGSNLGFDSTATYPATAIEITSADICNGVITFIQKIETANRAGAKALTKYANSDDERWILPRKKDSYILLLRDSHAYEDVGLFPGQSKYVITGASAESSGAYNAGSDDVKIFTVDNPSGAAEWITPKDKINTSGAWPRRSGFGYNHDWAAHPRDIGLKYIVKHFPAGTWACVRQTGTNKPEIIVLEGKKQEINAQDAKGVTVTRGFSESQQGATYIRYISQYTKQWAWNIRRFYRFHMHIYMRFPKLQGQIYWTGDPIPENHFSYIDQRAYPKPITGSVWATHTRTTNGSFWWSHRQNPEFQTMSNPLHPYNWHGDTNMRGRQQFQRDLQFTGIRGDGREGILFDGHGLVKNTIVHPSHWDNEGGTKENKVYKNTSTRLCSYTPGGAITIQTHAGQSTIHTTAKIAKSDNSIEFEEATLQNFVAGDNIRVSGGLMKSGNSSIGTNLRRIGLNLPRDTTRKRLGIDIDTGYQHEYFIARIKEVVVGSPGKLLLEKIPGFETKYMNEIDEDCYPIITTIDNDLQAARSTAAKPITRRNEDGTTTTYIQEGTYFHNDPDIPTQKRSLIRTGLEVNTLLGCNHGRRWGHIGDNESVEVRNDAGAGVTNSDYAHKIDWDGRTVRAANTSGSNVRIVYMQDGMLKSQNGIDSDVSPQTSVFSETGTFHLTNTLLTVADNGNITVYDPNLNIQFVKGRPEKQTGLGLTEDILDGMSVSNGYGIFIFVKYHKDGAEYWKMVKTGSKPETTLLGYNFIRPIEYDGVNAWGTFKDDSGNYDIHTTVPFYESNIEGSWVNHSSNSNGDSAWGQILKSRLSKADRESNIKRWLSVDWKYDSGVWNNTGNPVIGLAHEANKMVGVNNEFTWYLLDAPDTLEYDGQGRIIEEPKVAIKFNSKITRDVVFFKTTETVLPVSGQTGAENRVSFTNYEVGAQKFYVLNDNIISLLGEDPEEQGYQLGQSDTSQDAFDASRVGRSAYLVGAPNMYNPYGPNIDFYYRASFIDKWNNESVPSPLPTAGIEPLDSADDCIQINLSPEFFRFDNEDITKIRLYRYGGDSSEFMFLRDIPIPTISSFPLAIPESGTGFAGTLAIKAALSSFYNLKTNYNISELGNFTNSAFDLTATPTHIDGSWRVNQVYEAEPPTVAYASGLAEDLNETDTTVKLIGTTNPSAWPTSGVIKIESEYISYSGISTNDLTGCVRGYYESKASQHKGGRVKPYSSSQDFNITNAGAGYGHVSNNNLYSSADVVATIESDGGTTAKLQVRKVAHNLVNGVSVILKSTTVGGALPVGLVNTKNYFVVNKANDTFQLALTSGGDAINVTGTDLGSGTFTYNGCVLYAATGGFNGSYTVDTGGGAITGASILNPGSGYTGVPTVLISDPGLGQTGASAVVAASVDGGGNATVVEWVLEMEHRNQDTTTLTVAIETSAVPSVIYVDSTDVFPTGSGSTKILIGNQIINYTGKGADGLSFTGCTHNTGGGIETTHSVGVLVLSYNETYTQQAYTNISLEVNAFGYRDKSRTPVMSLHSMKEDNWPPLAMTYNEEKKQFFETEATDDFYRYVTAVGSLYFGAVDADLRFSRYGSPEYWPLEAVVTLDSEIKGIMEHAGEGIVFTTNSVYRVRGTDPKAMVAFRVPDAKGIKDGDRHSIAEFNGGIIWKTASDGLCMYSGGRVSYLTRDKHNIPNMDKPNSCVADGVYWLFQRPRGIRESGDTGNGFRLELTGGDLRLCQTSIQAYYSYFAKALGKAVAVTSDNSLSESDTSFVVQEIGGTKANNISWRSKKIDVGEPAVAKAFGSIAIVYESLESQISPTLTDGIRGESLAVSLLGLGADDLDAGDLESSALDGASDLYDVFTKYDSVGQEFVADIGGTNWNSTQRKTILMPVGFDTSTVNVGDSVWNELLADNTKVASVGTETVGGTVYPTIVLNAEPLRSGTGNIIWGNLPEVHIYVNNESTPSRSFTLPPIVSEEPQSADLYLEDLRRFRTISVKVEGNLRVNTISLRHFPVQQFQSQTLHHSADIFYKGIVDFRVKLDGELIYRKELANAGDEFTEERIYLPASSFGSRVHYMNESRSGMIESVTFNGSLAA